MIRQNALCRSGIDLDQRSSTARTGRPLVRADQVDERKDFLIQRDGMRFAGMHLIVDVWDGHRLDDIDHVRETLLACIRAAGATLLHIHLHHFTPNGGVSGVAVLAESHISIHSWPERGYAAMDIFMCGAAQPEQAIPVLEEAFGPCRVTVMSHARGAGL